MMTRVLTCGVFDLVHTGHIRLLRAARRLGGTLIVGVQDDAHVVGVLGKRPPILTTDERVDHVVALGIADDVIVYQSGTDGAVIDRVRPDIYVHGDDWHAQADRSVVLERLAACGGRVVLLPRTPGVSTSEIRKRVLRDAVPTS